MQNRKTNDQHSRDNFFDNRAHANTLVKKLLCVISVASLVTLSACSGSSGNAGPSTNAGNTGNNANTTVGTQNDNNNQNTTDGNVGNDNSDTSGSDNNNDTNNNDTNDNTNNNTSDITSDNGQTRTLPAINFVTELSPLPQPPLTPAPSAQDEPVPVSGPVSTVTEYFLVQNPGPRLPDDTSGKITEAEFAAGPLPAVITTPEQVDPTLNRAPYFVDLNDQTVFAGDMMELVLQPLDPDGDIPGMYPESLPEGSQYIDNLNGTRTLKWRPLEPDVGIREFVIVAVDPVEPQYRTRRVVRIKVLMPADPSTIVNLAPGINAVRRHTVRVNDPVVVQIKGTDPNGTIPRLEVLNQPAGATFIPHPIEPEFSILRFVPRQTGLITLQVRAYDALNENSTTQISIEIDVRDPSDFIRSGTPLRDLATPRGFRMGYASLKDFYYRPDGKLYADTAAQEFNFVSSENSLKWSFVNPLPGRYRWASADNLVTFARTKGMEVHGHTLVWHRQLPDWIKNSDLDSRETHMREYIDRVLDRYADRIPIWDVVNEAFEDDGTYRNSTWFQAMGPDYIDIAFRQARQSAPNARLLYNDYDVSWDGPKFDSMYSMLQSLKDNGTPITGVGFQMHVFASFDQYDEVIANFQKVADLDLDIYITELDVSITDGATEAQQAEVYKRIMDICLDQARCKGFQIWGFTDMYSWRREYNPLILDEAYQPKPAYWALQQRLTEN